MEYLIELFDRRYEHFCVVRDFLGSILRYGKVMPEERDKFMVGIRGMILTFDKEIAEYVEKTLLPLAVELECLASELEGVPVGEKTSKNVRRKEEIKKELHQHLKDIEERFAPYLQLEH